MSYGRPAPCVGVGWPSVVAASPPYKGLCMVCGRRAAVATNGLIGYHVAKNSTRKVAMTTERRIVRYFNTASADFKTHEQMRIAYHDWLNGLPGRLFSEGPTPWNATVRMAITIVDEPANLPDHDRIYETDAQRTERVAR